MVNKTNISLIFHLVEIRGGVGEAKREEEEVTRKVNNGRGGENYVSWQATKQRVKGETEETSLEGTGKWRKNY